LPALPGALSLGSFSTVARCRRGRPLYLHHRKDLRLEHLTASHQDRPSQSALPVLPRRTPMADRSRGPFISCPIR
jgi:hypothetical protein